MAFDRIAGNPSGQARGGPSSGCLSRRPPADSAVSAAEVGTDHAGDDDDDDDYADGGGFASFLLFACSLLVAFMMESFSKDPI